MSDHVINNRFLNDDCLLKILSYLRVPELNSTVQVSRQFQNISQYTVKMRHGDMNLKEYSQINLNKFETLLENFSGYLLSLAIDVNVFPSLDNNREKKIIELLSKHFSNSMHSLNKLSLEYFKKLELIDIIELLPVVRTISNFKLHQVDIPLTIPELLTHLKHLNELSITYCRPSGPIFMTIFEPRDFTTNITKLNLTGNEHLLALYLLKKIHIYFPQIRELTFYMVLQGEHFSRQLEFKKDILQIAELRMLQKLSIDMEFNTITPLLQGFIRNNVRIIDMDINFAQIDNLTINSLMQLQTLTSLRLYGIQNINRKFILDIGNCLINLKSIQTNVCMSIKTLTQFVNSAKRIEQIDIKMHSKYVFNNQNYRNLLLASKNRLHPTKLLIRIRNSDGEPITVREKIILKRAKENESLTIIRTPSGPN